MSNSAMRNLRWNFCPSALPHPVHLKNSDKSVESNFGRRKVFCVRFLCLAWTLSMLTVKNKAQRGPVSLDPTAPHGFFQAADRTKDRVKVVTEIADRKVKICWPQTTPPTAKISAVFFTNLFSVVFHAFSRDDQNSVRFDLDSVYFSRRLFLVCLIYGLSFRFHSLSRVESSRAEPLKLRFFNTKKG